MKKFYIISAIVCLLFIVIGAICLFVPTQTPPSTNNSDDSTDDNDEDDEIYFLSVDYSSITLTLDESGVEITYNILPSTDIPTIVIADTNIISVENFIITPLAVGTTQVTLSHHGIDKVFDVIVTEASNSSEPSTTPDTPSTPEDSSNNPSEDPSQTPNEENEQTPNQSSPENNPQNPTYNYKLYYNNLPISNTLQVSKKHIVRITFELYCGETEQEFSSTVKLTGCDEQTESTLNVGHKLITFIPFTSGQFTLEINSNIFDASTSITIIVVD